jgi:hypothetical protein
VVQIHSPRPSISLCEFELRDIKPRLLSLTKIPCGLPQMPFPEAKRKALADRGPV